ncbi:glycosyl transferase [Glutamicibacter uratoxydans]|uniref:Glycosyl transferase n=1 Tax=Glutamicibacter uratoxydans TaxID=43667 RepID=A0A4Y4DT71_GLUUR|nr:nucleotide disphospho-sugar-binding domain-containing protein [Glutamicibacter uratoxydans]GED05691.1 glycosyl transferase [Glutamicibacter uratoxydans]
MRVLMIAPGTRGDVVPMAGLGSRLIPLGFDLAISANPAYAQVITDAGCEFRELPGDMSELVTPAAPGQKTTGSVLRNYFEQLGQYMELAAHGTLTAAQAGADVILANSVAPYAYDVGEALVIPVIGAHLQPTEPSSAYPPVVLGSARSLGAVGNKLLGRLISAGKAPYDAPAAKLRHELGLPPLTRAKAESRRRRIQQPILHGFSEHIVPRPADWHEGLSIDGYWWPAAAEGFQPSDQLAQFLADGPPPVFIGFGSTEAMDAQFMLDTARKAGVRAVLQGMEGIDEPDAISIGAVPHEWLFPRMAAVVHHSGAGTAAAGLRAGVPTVSVPIFTDQPFWAQRVHQLGAGPAPVPYKKLNSDLLAAAISQAVSDPAYARNAQQISRLLAGEDSVAPVAAALRGIAG